MILRFEQDVLRLVPQRVLLMPPLIEVAKPFELLARLRALCNLATEYDIQPVLVTLPPVGPAAQSEIDGGYHGRILTINRELAALAAEKNVPILDIFTPLAGADRNLFSEFVGPERWPNPRGYREMTRELQALMDSLRAPTQEETETERLIRLAEGDATTP
jgi:hypothetical protein